MRLLILGAGSIGTRHAHNAESIGINVGIFDVDVAKVKKLTAGTRRIGFRELSHAFDWRPDGVIIAVPHKLHVPLAVEALRHGAHVLIEKPLSTNMDGIDALRRLVPDTGKRCYVVSNMRFHPGIVLLKKHLPEIGNPLFGRAYVGNYLPNMRPHSDYRETYASRREMGGGVLFDAVHEIDYLRWLFGEVEDVYCRARTLGDLDIDVEDFAFVVAAFKNNVQFVLQLDYLRRFKQRGCEIVGSRGTLIWESLGKNPERCVVRGFSTERGHWTTHYDSTYDANAMYQAMLTDFLRAIDGAVDVDISTLDDGVAVLQATLAMHESACLDSRISLQTKEYEQR